MGQKISWHNAQSHPDLGPDDQQRDPEPGEEGGGRDPAKEDAAPPCDEEKMDEVLKNIEEISSCEHCQQIQKNSWSRPVRRI